MTEELKPCPFCGGPAHFYENEVDFVPVWCVGCDECPAGFDACGDTKAEVAALWNHRPVALAEGEPANEYFDMLWAWFEQRGAIVRADYSEGFSVDDFKTMLDEHEAALSGHSPAANAEQRRAEVCAAVAHVLHGRNRQCDYPIYETQDDRGLDEAEYIDFAMDVLASLRSRSQPETASQREIAINLLGWPSPEKAAAALLSKFNITRKTTEEPRG